MYASTILFFALSYLMYDVRSMHPLNVPMESVTKKSYHPRMKPWVIPFHPIHPSRELLDWLCKHPWITHTGESEIESNILYLFL